MTRPSTTIADLRLEASALMRLALPIVITQLAQHGFSVTDVIMAGNAGAVDLAAVSLGSAVWLLLFLFIIGVLTIQSSLVAHANGRGLPERAVFHTWQGLWLGLLLGMIGLAICQEGDWLLQWIDTSADVKSKAAAYLAAIGWSLPAIGLYQALRGFTEGWSRSRPVMAMTLLAAGLNIPADYVLVFGLGPVPAMGGVGCGWATTLVSWLLLLLAVGYTRWAARRGYLPHLFEHFRKPEYGGIRELFGLGLPVALGIFFEASLFSIMSVLVAPYGATALASHQIAYNASATTYMVPLALGLAITVRVGFRLGEGQPQQAARVAFLGIGLGALLALGAGIALFLGGTTIADWYSDQPGVIEFGGYLLGLAAIFQISDSIQAATSGALRGYKDTRAIMLATLAAYWLIGLPVGVFLADGAGLFEGLGVTGYWVGLICGLSAAAVLLLLRLVVLVRGYRRSAIPQRDALSDQQSGRGAA
ncbi:MATE family efflux transporter [Marinobacteraceae bacterium S3BR75-40.1]